MANSQTEAGNIQDDTGDSCSTRSKEVLKKKKIKNDQSMSTEHRSHMKEFPLPKLEQFEQKNSDL